MGLSFLAPAFVAFASTAGVFLLALYIGEAQKIWIEGIQTRVNSTALMLGLMKVGNSQLIIGENANDPILKGIKMLGFTDRLTEIIQGLRERELRLSTQFRRLLLVRVFLGINVLPLSGHKHRLTCFTGNITTALAPLVTFIVFVVIANSTGRTLNTSAAFTGLSLISLLSSPMHIMISTIPMLNASMACFVRIQTFLNSDARKDHRLPLSPSSGLNESQNPARRPKASN